MVFLLHNERPGNDRAVSEIVATLLMVFLLLGFVSVALITFTDIDLPGGKTPYICVSAERDNFSGLDLISVRNNGGDSAGYYPFGDGQEQVIFRVESSEGDIDAAGTDDLREWSPGVVYYIYKSGSGYYVTDNPSGIADALPLPDGNLGLVVSDAIDNVLIYTANLGFEGNGSSNETPVSPVPGFSAEAWIKWNKNPAPASSDERWATIAVYGNRDNNRKWHIQHNQGNSLFEFLVATTSTGSAGRWVQSTTGPQEGLWYHIVGVYNQNLTSDNLNIYVNGVDATQTGYSVTGDLRSITGSLQMGGPSGINYPSPGMRKFDGDIRGFTTYGRALTPAEITAKYDAGVP